MLQEQNIIGCNMKNQDMALVHKYMAQQSESELFLKTGYERAQTRQTAGGHGLAI